MTYLNKVVLIGNLVRDPELKPTGSGKAVSDLTLALEHHYRDGNGEKHSETSFINVTAWGRQAEIIAEHCKKGDSLVVEGRLKSDTWEDKDTGKKRSKLFVIMNGFQFMPNTRRSGGGGKRGQSEGDSQQREESAPESNPADFDGIPF